MDLLSLLLASTRIIGWALVHFLWQATLLGLVYKLTRALLPRGEARYRVGLATLIAMAVCPLLTIWRLAQVPAGVAVSLPDVPATAFAGAESVGGATWDSCLESFLPWMVLAWSCGVFFLALRAWSQWRKVKALVRAANTVLRWQKVVDIMAERFRLRRRVTVLCSKVVGTPVLVGWLRPVILLPVAVVFNFPAAQIELILAHELAHLRRWDPLANLFQIVLETLHFYHPVVHWISNDVRNEREICCDAMALAVSGGSRREFAEALAELGDLSERHGPLLLAASGGVLMDRVQQMIGTHPHPHPARAAVSARFIAVLLGAILIASTLRIEWGQARLRDNMAESIRQLQTALTPQWLPLVQSIDSAQLRDLVPARVEALRLLAAEPLGPAAIEGAVLPIITRRPMMSPRLSPVSLQIEDLVHAIDRPGVHFAEWVPAPDAAVAPKPIQVRQPVYPQAALIRGVEGSVVIEFAIAKDGSVRDEHVVSAEPIGIFDESALQAMRGWKYATVANASTLHRYRQTLAFSLDAAEGKRTAKSVTADDRIQAQVDCRIPTGTHICRLFGNNVSAGISEVASYSLGH